MNARRFDRLGVRTTGQARKTRANVVELEARAAGEHPLERPRVVVREIDPRRTRWAAGSKPGVCDELGTALIFVEPVEQRER